MASNEWMNPTWHGFAAGDADTPFDRPANPPKQAEVKNWPYPQYSQ